MTTSNGERPASQVSVDIDRPVQPMLLRVVGMLSLVACALAVYFFGVAEYLDDSALAPADQALVRALRVVAGACAISGIAVGMYVLTQRDRAILEAQASARRDTDRTA
ncbi:hypothetical protein [Nocardioides zeicaulis]|uniref:Uncharacterized protein n=1 Tax=Nocardioides zeicaulis TaxID=1776857 RepID=A0ABV6DW12_9ACTN